VAKAFEPLLFFYLFIELLSYKKGFWSLKDEVFSYIYTIETTGI